VIRAMQGTGWSPLGLTALIVEGTVAALAALALASRVAGALLARRVG
jgi:hypothetical protein